MVFITGYQNPFLIYNPSAGGIRERLLKDAISILESPGCRVTALPTTGPNSAAAVAREAIRAKADLIIAAGGDGTINEVANGVVGSDVPFAVLPAGTANVLAHELGLPLRIDLAARLLENCVPERISVGALRAEGFAAPRYFLTMAGIGLDALIVYRLNLRLKAKLGRLAYWIAGFSQIGRRLPQFDLCLEGRSHRCGFALASRVRNYGGDLEIAGTANLLAHDFEVVLFEGEKAARYLRYLAGMIARRLPAVAGVEILRARKVEVGPSTDSRVYIQVDGEYAGRLPATIEIVESSLTLLIPPAFREKMRSVEA